MIIKERVISESRISRTYVEKIDLRDSSFNGCIPPAPGIRFLYMKDVHFISGVNEDTQLRGKIPL